MKKERKIFVFAVLTVFAVCTASRAVGLMNMNNIKPNRGQAYDLIKESEVAEINSRTYLLEHKKSGARIFIIKNDDDNKVFSIGFRTPPLDNTGAPHILEHSVLCGSKKYPVKDPFLIMSKQSLSTFLNAITYPDMTLYPISSRNEKDFENLMDIYLDAVFYPNIYKNPNILKQEGWHYELNKDQLSISGVVYNEMKGEYSSPSGLLFTKIKEVLFPGHPYGFDSGGDPSSIPQLTQEKFLALHSKYYHPSNSYIYLYGNLNMEKTLEYLDREYLSKFDSMTINTAVPIAEGFSQVKDAVGEYPVSLKTKTAGTYFSLSYVMGNVLNQKTMIELDILNDLLMSTPAAPLRKALIDGGIGENAYSEFDTTMQQPIFSIVYENCDINRKDEFPIIIKEALKEVIKNGFNEKLIAATLNSYELNVRDVNASADRGLIFIEDCMAAWIHGGEPLQYLELMPIVEEIKKNMNPHYFDGLIEEFFLQNTHSAAVTLVPEPGLEEKSALEGEGELEEIKNGMTPENLDRIQTESRILLKWQNTADTKENLDKIPHLTLKEIDKKQEEIPSVPCKVEGIDILKHSIYTNGLAYLDLYFDTRAVPQEDLMYLLLLDSLMGSMSTKKYEYGDLANEIGIVTGDLEFSIKNHGKYDDDRDVKPYLNISTFTSYDKLGEMIGLLEEIINHTKLDDKKRFHGVIKEIKADMREFILENGSKLANRRVLSYFSPSEAYNDLGYLPYYQFICDLDKNFSKNYETVTVKLEEIMDFVFTKENLLIGITMEDEGYHLFEEAVADLGNSLSTASYRKHDYFFEKNIKNEGLILTGKVQYVAQGSNYRRLGYDFNGKLRVLQNILESEYLWQEIRVKGGAYGTHLDIYANGNAVLSSYRDPNLKETLDVYNKVADYVENFDGDEKEMTNLIVGTIGQMDSLKSPWAKGKTADRMVLSQMPQEYLQKVRDEVLSTSPKDIRNFAPMIRRMTEESCITVVGSKGKIKQNKEVFMETKEIFK